VTDDGVRGYALSMPVRFRGLTERQGLLWRGPAGWTEWSPFLDYSGAELLPWLRAAEPYGHRQGVAA
jgi:O-succinylbenzoate synthase